LFFVKKKTCRKYSLKLRIRRCKGEEEKRLKGEKAKR